MNTTHQNSRTGPTAWRRGMLAALLVAGLTTLGSIAGAGAAAADTGASFAGCPQLDEGDTGPCITQLQQKLTKVHPEYNLPGSETFGPATRIALLDFQGRNHLGADGRFGTTTARELDRQYDAANVGGGAVASPQPKPIEPTPDAGSSLPGCPQLDLGDTGPCVAQLQELLTKVHPEYQLPGSQTYGLKTQRAVADFQERNHITGGKGQFGPGTAKALQNQAARGQRPVVEEPKDPTPGTSAGIGGSATGCIGEDCTKEDPRPENPTPVTGCTGKDCTNKDPRTMRCDRDARTVSSEDLVVSRSRTASTETGVKATGSVSGEGDATGGAAGVPGAGVVGGRVKGEGKAEGSIGIDRSKTREYVDLVAGTIEIRYSAACHAAWAKVTTKSKTPLESLKLRSDGGKTVGTDGPLRYPGGRLGNGESTPAGNYYTNLLGVSDTDQVTATADGTRGDVDFSPNHNQSAGPVTPATS